MINMIFHHFVQKCHVLACKTSLQCCCIIANRDNLMMTFHWTIFWCNETNMFVLLLVVLCLTMIFFEILENKIKPRKPFLLLCDDDEYCGSMEDARDEEKNDAHASAMWFFEIYFLFVTNTKKLYFLFTHFMLMFSTMYYVQCSFMLVVRWV